MEPIQEKIDIVRRAHREMNSIKNTTGDSPTEAEVIINLLNHISMKDVTKEIIDRS